MTIKIKWRFCIEIIICVHDVGDIWKRNMDPFFSIHNVAYVVYFSAVANPNWKEKFKVNINGLGN